MSKESLEVIRSLFAAVEEDDFAVALALFDQEVQWSPTEGDFQWDWLDGEVAKVAATGKQVLLRIITKSARPGWVSSCRSPGSAGRTTRPAGSAPWPARRPTPGSTASR